ncbi:MAG: phage/plasmid primase, P4 family [Cohaesibacter sp.]|nr:phage/plasmid primase, P4 family [Cohaesibacter sp.]
MTDEKTMLGHALDLAKRGFSVFPADPKTKRPLIKEWGKHACADPEKITHWWERFPKAMIGVPMGAASDCWVLDLDAKTDPETGEVIAVEDLIDQIEQAIGEPLPPALTAVTPRGGYHLYFKWPTDGREVRNRGAMLPHVDVRGQGGYVIAPPSVRSDGVCYNWRNHILPRSAPKCLLDLVIKKADPVADGSDITPANYGAFSSTLAREDDAVRKYALSAVDAECQGVRLCGKGGRNDRLNRAAFSIGTLVGAGVVSRAMAFSMLQDAAYSNGMVRDDGLKSAQATINSGLDDGALSPRDLSDIRAKAARRANRGIGINGGGMAPPPANPADYGFPDDERKSPGKGEKEQEKQLSEPEKPKEKRKRKSQFSTPPKQNDCSDLDRELAELDRNDLGNAERLQRRFGDDLLYVRDMGWHFWDGAHWSEVGAWEFVHQRAHETAKAIQDEAAALRFDPPGRLETADDIDDYVNKHFSFAISSGNAGRIANMVTTAQNYMTVEPCDMDADLMVINLQNGTMRLAGSCEDLQPHRREDRLAKVMPVDYMPDAKCPDFMHFLDTAIPNKEKQAFIQVWAGLCLTGVTSEQKFVFNFGEGGNGKSVFMDLLAKMMGPYAATINFSTLLKDDRKRGSEATPDLARLPGKRLVKASEPERGSVLAEAVIKEITGGEPLQVRKLREDFFEFFPQFKLMVSGNHRPSIRSADRGIWRRVILFHWDQNIPENQQDKKLPDKLWAERNGILNWLLDGVRRWLDEGLQVPDIIAKETKAYQEDSDPLGRFILDCIETAPGEEVNATTLYEAYCSWAKQNEAPVYKSTGFGRAMVERGLEKRKKRTVSYLNIRINYVVPAVSGTPNEPPVPDGPEDYID